MEDNNVFHTSVAPTVQSLAVDRPRVQMKVWQDWPGNQCFLWDGRVMLARTKWIGSVGTFLSIFVPVCLFLGLVVPKLDSPTHWVAAVIVSLLAVLAIYLLLCTCLMDPGILPKLQPDEDYMRLSKPRSKEVVIRGSVFCLKYDEVYHFYRPPRAHHCKETNVVIEKLDHFCPWMGQTIGLRNYRSFVSFLATALLLLLSTIGFCIALLVQYNDSNQKASNPQSAGDQLRHTYMAPILIVYCAGFLLVVSVLFSYHLYLIAVGQTTYESHKGTPAVFSRGLCNNCHDVWCMPTPAPFVLFDQPIEDAQRTDPPRLIQQYNPPWCDAQMT